MSSALTVFPHNIVLLQKTGENSGSKDVQQGLENLATLSRDELQTAFLEKRNLSETLVRPRQTGSYLTLVLDKRSESAKEKAQGGEKEVERDPSGIRS
jgi:hypothetical protein